MLSLPEPRLLGGLLLVLAVGHSANGAQRWIQVLGFQIQPSEFAKLAFVLWGADLLARKEKAGQLTEWRHLLIRDDPTGAFELGNARWRVAARYRWRRPAGRTVAALPSTAGTFR